MAADTEKGNRIVSKLITAGRTIQGTQFRAELAKVIADENPDSETIVYVMSQVPIEARTALPFAAEYLTPFLQVRVASEQTAAAEKFGRKTDKLAKWALIFSLIQAGCALITLYLALRPVVCK